MESDDRDDSTALRLRIPDPARGADPAERVRRHLSPAGEMRKPELDEKVERIALMRKQLVRVLDEDGKACGPWVPDLTPEQLITGSCRPFNGSSALDSTWFIMSTRG